MELRYLDHLQVGQVILLTQQLPSIMPTNFMSNPITRSLLVLCFLAIGNQIYAMGGVPCVMPGCSDGCYDPPAPFNSNNEIRRTYLLDKKVSFNKTFSRNSTQELPVSINEQDILNMFSLGNRSIRRQSADGSITSIDVGTASTDTQFWFFPQIDFIEGEYSISIDPSTAPYADSFAGTNIVHKGYSTADQDTIYTHYKLDSNELVKLGHAIDDGSTLTLLDWFDSEAFLPIETGWEIDETITTLWSYNTTVDSIVQHKTLSVDATGMMTPFGENPVPAVLSFVEYEFTAYKDGVVFSEEVYDAFVWFSTEGHRVYGILQDGAPVEGVTQFSKIVYERYVKPCGGNLDLGIDPFDGEFKAQNDLVSAADLVNSPIQFVAGNGVELKSGFSTNGEFEAVTNGDPCNE